MLGTDPSTDIETSTLRDLLTRGSAMLPSHGPDIVLDDGATEEEILQAFNRAGDMASDIGSILQRLSSPFRCVMLDKLRLLSYSWADSCSALIAK